MDNLKSAEKMHPIIQTAHNLWFVHELEVTQEILGDAKYQNKTLLSY